jgi:hypothetical protein
MTPEGTEHRLQHGQGTLITVTVVMQATIYFLVWMGDTPTWDWAHRHKIGAWIAAAALQLIATFFLMKPGHRLRKARIWLGGIIFSLLVGIPAVASIGTIVIVTLDGDEYAPFIAGIALAILIVCVSVGFPIVRRFLYLLKHQPAHTEEHTQDPTAPKVQPDNSPAGLPIPSIILGLTIAFLAWAIIHSITRPDAKNTETTSPPAGVKQSDVFSRPLPTDDNDHPGTITAPPNNVTHFEKYKRTANIHTPSYFDDFNEETMFTNDSIKRGTANGVSYFETIGRSGHYAWWKQPFSKTVVEVTGRVTKESGTACGWIVILSQKKARSHGVQVVVFGDGQMWIRPSMFDSDKSAGPRLKKIRHPAIKPAGQWNTLRVAVSDNTLGVHMNGQEILKPMRLKFPLDSGRVALGINAPGENSEGRAEITSFAIWPTVNLWDLPADPATPPDPKK